VQGRPIRRRLKFYKFLESLWCDYCNVKRKMHTTRTGFNTLERERQALNPPTKGSHLPELHKLISPHLDSFNAIKATNDGRGRGLLEMAVGTISRQEVKDSHGNRIRCK
jgi:hypothetical protein